MFTIVFFVLKDIKMKSAAVMNCVQLPHEKEFIVVEIV